MIEYILNGKPVKVKPEDKEHFENANPGAVLASEKPTKETDPSQNNQQLKVDEDVSIDMTTGEVISKKQVIKKKEISLELQNEELNEIDNREIYNFEANDPDFFGSEPQDAIEKLKHVFGEGDESIFEYNNIDNNKLEILHKHSGKSTIIDLNIGLDEYEKQALSGYLPEEMWGNILGRKKEFEIPLKEKQKIYNEAVKNNSNKLFNFFDETLKEWEYDKIKTNQESLIKDHELRQQPGGPLHISNAEKQEIKDRYSRKAYILNGNSIEVEPQDVKAFEESNPTAKEVSLFDVELVSGAEVGEMGRRDFVFGRKQQFETTPTKRYAEELEQARQSLINSGVKNPTKEQIENVTRNILIGKEIDALYDDKFNKYMNSDEVEGKGGIINKVKIAAQLSSNRQAKELITLNETRKSKIKNIEDSVELKRLEEYREIFSDKKTKINISELEENVKLENGKIIPKSMFDDYNRNLAIVKSKYKSLNKWLEDNNDKIEELESSDYKNDLIQRNYDDFEKFIHNVGSGLDRIGVGAGYFVVKSIQSRAGFKEIDTKAIDQIKLDYDTAAQIYHNEYQKDVKFDDAFKSSFNFGKFVAQEMGQQLPIFATLAVPYVGIPALGLSSAGDNWSDMIREDKETESNTSTLKKFWTSAGYGTAEVIFDRWITRANMYSSFRGLTGRSKKLINESWAGVKHFAKYNTFKNLVYMPASEVASESFTTITQNVLRGRPITENLGHAAFSGGMFGFMFGGAPFIKGLVMNKLSTNKEIREWDSMNKEMTDIQQQLLWADEINLDPKIRKSLEDRLSDLKAKSVSMFDAMEKDIGELSDDAVRGIFLHRAKAEELRRKARELEADNTIDIDTKKKLLEEWTKEYNKTLAQIDYIKNPINRTAFKVFTVSDEESDKKRKESLFQKAFNSLVSGDSYSNKRKIILDPSDKQIAEEARLIFNTEEVYKDIRNKQKTGLGKDLKVWSTVEKAIFEIEKMDNISEKTKAELIKSLQEELVHGSNIPTIDPKTGKSTGKFIPFQIVENMAKDDRLETKTHELGHMALTEAISSNPEAFSGIAEQILEYTKVTNPRLYNKLKAISLMLPIDEVLTNYMEFIVDESVNFNDSKNRGLGPMIAWMFGEGVKKATNSDIKYNFRGETDAINFITQLAKKIKNGTLDIKDIRDIKESPVGKEAIKEGKKAEKEKGKQIPTSKFSKAIDAKPFVDKLSFNEKTGKTYTKEEWDEEGANKAIEEIKKKRKVLEGEGYLDKLIAAKYKVKPVPESFVDDVIGSTFFINHVKAFNPEINNSLFGWVNSQIRNKAGSVFNQNERGKIPKGVKTVEIDAVTTEGKARTQVADVDTSMETFTDNINYFQEEVQPKDTESRAEQSKLRKEIGIGNLGKGEIFKKVRTALATSKAINEEGFLKDFEKNLANLLEPTIARILNDPAKLKKFRVGILEAIPIKTLVQMQKFLPEKIFIKDHGRQTNLTNLSRFVEKGLLPASILNDTAESKKRRAAGVRVYERLNTTTKQFENYIDAPTIDTKTGKRSGTRGNNRAKVISEVSKAIGKDATPETLTPEFIEDYLNVKDLKGKITPEKLIEKISEQIDRSPDLKFSKRIQNDYTISPAGIAAAINQKLVPGSGEGRNLNAIYDEKTGETFFEARNRVINDFVEENPQYKEMLRKGLTGGKRSLVGTKTEFNKYTPVVNVEQIDPSRLTYTDKRKFDTKVLDKLKTKKWKDNEAAKLKALEGFFIAIQNHLKTNPNNAWLFLEMLRDSSAAGQNHIIRILAPFKFYAVEPGTNKPVINKEVVEEHTAPQNQIGTALMYAAIRGDVKEVFSVIGQSYMQGSLLHTDDVIIGDNKLGSTMPAIYFEKIIPRLRDGSLKLPDGMSSVVRMAVAGINLNDLMLVDSNQTISEFFGVGRFKNASELVIENQNDLIVKYLTGEITKKEASKIMEEVAKIDKTIKYSKSQIDNTFNAIEAFNKQAKLIKKINKEIQADLEKSGYTFVEKSKYSKKGKARGMSTFDFDETLIIDGENFVIATDPNTGEKINIKSGDWPIKGPELAEQGYEFNFDDFVNVRGGVSGPLLQKMKNQIKKYGPENVFILTARPQSADTAIHEWLKSKGINIPFKNITGLANSTGQAKADWMLNKFAEGYNDMYFVDDALPNVKAVKDVLEQLDIKSKVVQAKIKFSKKITLDFDKILEQSKGMQAGKKFSAAEARKRGIGKGKMKFFVPPSAEDFKGLIYSFLGKGREGDAHAAWFKENLFDPFAKGIRDWNSYKQAMSNDYNELKKQFPKVGKMLNKKVKGTSFTNDAAIRVYLWNKAGFEIPGISKALQDKLVKHVEGNSELKQFAEGLSIISRVAEGYMKPSNHWVAESIASDLANTVLKLGRKDFLAEWIQNKNIIFSEQNLNKIEAIYGTGFREALENMLYRMETGRNRTTGKDATVNKFLDWINGSVGAVMFFNIRSAALQTISTINFINWGDNNVFKAATAFANQVQFWKDFAYIFNSDMLKQRRAGLQIDVSASELTKAFHDGRSTPQAVIAYLLEKGFLPTQIADSFAIAMGGSTFYRNRLKTYLKQGMSEAKAKEQAWLDFQEIAEETQQSSRPDLISMQQAGVLGRIILAWQNTPMQMTRLTKKALSDLVNRRRRAGMGQFQSDTSNISRIMYYGLIQNLWFGALQTGLMFMMFGWDEDEERKQKLEIRVANGALDTLLRGTGVYGAAISTLKNVILKWREESQKGWNRDDLRIAQEAISLSPPLGSKLRKIMNAVRTEKYNKGVSEKIGLRIENPNLSIAVNLTEALTNIPVARLVNKANNVEEALSGNHDIWQRVALVSGWNRWDVGVKDEELEQAKKEAKEERRIKKKQEKAKDKKIKQAKKVRCVRIKSNGERCKNRTDKKNKRCYAHQ